MNKTPMIFFMSDNRPGYYFDRSWLRPAVASFLIRAQSGGGGHRTTMVRGFHEQTGSLILYSRDNDMHTSGWWKNPEYERCRHLSLSFHATDLELGENYGKVRPVKPQDMSVADQWVDAFFGASKRMIWCEPPTYPEGKALDVWHYRLFCDEHWQPIKPRGEVYSKELTEAGWLSWSDAQEQRRKAFQAAVEEVS